jgi:hypothetical protein
VAAQLPLRRECRHPLPNFQGTYRTRVETTPLSKPKAVTLLQVTRNAKRFTPYIGKNMWLFGRIWRIVGVADEETLAVTRA